MSDNKLAVVQQPTGGAIQVSAEWEKQMDLIAKTVAPGLNQAEFQLFCHVARVKHLDPLQRQIHAVKRKSYAGEDERGNAKYEDRMTIQTGIDGYRAIANRTGVYMPSEKEPRIEDEGKPNLRITVWVKKFSTCDSQWHEFSATARYTEFAQTKRVKDGARYVEQPLAMWKKMPINQLTKCAEALALRKGWPEELAGIYVDEELQQGDEPQHLQPTTVLPPEPKKTKTEREVATMQPSPQQNRGHGQEGTQQKVTPKEAVRQEKPKAEPKSENVICANCQTQNGHTADCPDNTVKKNMRGWLYVDSAIAGETKQKKPFLTMKCSARGGQRYTIYCYHKTLLDQKNLLDMNWIDCEVKETQKEDRTLYSLEAVHAVEDSNGITHWKDNKPTEEDLSEQGMTAEDAGFDTP